MMSVSNTVSNSVLLFCEGKQVHLLSALTPAVELVTFALKVLKKTNDCNALHTLSNTINDVSAITLAAVARFKTLMSPTLESGKVPNKCTWFQIVSGGDSTLY